MLTHTRINQQEMVFYAGLCPLAQHSAFTPSTRRSHFWSSRKQNTVHCSKQCF